MRNKIALTTLSVALVLGSASVVMAKSHKAHEAMAMDPREASQMNNKGGWCNIDPSCNGWSNWLQGVHAGAKYQINGLDVYGKY
jgi:hypothetical protein